MTKHKPVLQSKLVTWTFESNPDGDAWALFVHVSGRATQVSPWHAAEAELVETLKRIGGFSEPPTTVYRSGDVTPSPPPEAPDAHK